MPEHLFALPENGKPFFSRHTRRKSKKDRLPCLSLLL